MTAMEPHDSANPEALPHRVGWDPILFFVSFGALETARSLPGLIHVIARRHDRPYGPWRFQVTMFVTGAAFLLLLGALGWSVYAYRRGWWRFDLTRFRLSGRTWFVFLALAAAAIVSFWSVPAAWGIAYAAYLAALVHLVVFRARTH